MDKTWVKLAYLSSFRASSSVLYYQTCNDLANNGYMYNGGLTTQRAYFVVT